MRSTAFLKYYRSVRVVAVGAQRQAEAGLKERFERLAAELELERQRSNRSRNTCRLHSACQEPRARCGHVWSVWQFCLFDIII